MPRYYSSVAVRATLTAAVTPTTGSLAVNVTTGFPGSVPFTMILDGGTVKEEVVTVTSVSGLTLSVTRGDDGTTATDHAVGTAVVHGLTARDLREPQDHIAATAAHGVAQVAGAADIATHAALTTGVHGVGGGNVASTINASGKPVGRVWDATNLALAADGSINVGAANLAAWPDAHTFNAWYINGSNQRLPMTVVREEKNTGLIYLNANGAGTGTVVYYCAVGG